MINALSEKKINDLKENFRNAGPFPHVVIDDFLLGDFFNKISDEMTEYYAENKHKGKKWNTDAENGKWGSTGLNLPENLAKLDAFLKSESFLKLLENISGFEGLKVTKNINGIGFSFFHAMKPGAFLIPHTDHTRDLNNGPYHVLNVIIYMSKEWDVNWGGGTTLFDNKVNLKADIEYRPNRALIFMHSPDSIHGTQKVSDLAINQRFSTYYDYYSEASEPYKHLGIPKFKLINSPHIFYLPKLSLYFKKENFRYAKMHLAHFKRKLLSIF